jgi:hypothetical protein
MAKLVNAFAYTPLLGLWAFFSAKDHFLPRITISILQKLRKERIGSDMEG